jgi:hypothetical protein
VTEVLYESPPASPSPPPILPAGTRLAARLSQPLVVGPGGAPVVVDLADDVPIDARTAVPRGTRLVGEARVGPEGERAQLSFTSLVLRGRSLGLSGIAMGPDNQVGLTGKVVKRLTATRRGLGKALHAVGTALSFGLIGTTSPAGEAATQAVAGEVSGLSRSDEAPVVLEVAAGPLVVFVRADVSLP